MFKTKRFAAAFAAVATTVGFVAVAVAPAANAAPGPVGQGFTVTASDLAFILKQIKIAERHAATLRRRTRAGRWSARRPTRSPTG